LPADRVPPGIKKLAGKAALLRYFLSENHRSGVRHRIYIFSRIVGDDESHLVASCAWPISPDVHERLTALPNSPPCRTRSPDMASKPHATPVACGFESAACR
jgi:hypothetical protein